MVFSLMVPVLLYWRLWRIRMVSHISVVLFGLLTVAVAGVDFSLLQFLTAEAKRTISLWDDMVFNSEITLALYLLPGLMVGVGINMISHVLIRHLSAAERLYDKVHDRPAKQQHPDR